mmetsp:Transcript_53816/g.128206  ORF Transcript_53816/g.128206 Transcript_53816/m.128206 type:complete len:118 (+) Transcript_53816:113-466(+)|eukprot:CAMPEP_0178413900 /NCGR_PEP_ID=MMETSP0689_2-20121128/22763_1 /TAXON_ID=160604 /ORGANISM="Amphidinium massartii, Strain CS-259" /LENGTH=117 /DNA_ID=CAMNT_0020035181 /DNA_START=27 /DNA_END=380 /DNA_ORIENTATION=+
MEPVLSSSAEERLLRTVKDGQDSLTQKVPDSKGGLPESTAGSGAARRKASSGSGPERDRAASLEIDPEDDIWDGTIDPRAFAQVKEAQERSELIARLEGQNKPAKPPSSPASAVKVN